MKTFEEVQSTMDKTLQHCLMTTEKFLNLVDAGSVISYDGVGDVHDGEDFITNGFKTDIFDFINDKAATMTREEFIQTYPYVAWYNK